MRAGTLSQPTFLILLAFHDRLLLHYLLHRHAQCQAELIRCTHPNAKAPDLFPREGLQVRVVFIMRISELLLTLVVWSAPRVYRYPLRVICLIPRWHPSLRWEEHEVNKRTWNASECSTRKISISKGRVCYRMAVKFRHFTDNSQIP